MSEPGERVECYSGGRYGEEPRAFEWDGRRREVRRVEARWRTPDGLGFRVEVEPGERFELRYDEQADRWAIRQLDDHPVQAAGNLGQGGPIEHA